MNELKCLNRPLMIGTSRKSFIGNVLELSEMDGISKYNSQLIGTLVTLVIAITKGINIIRVHDVKEAVQVAKMCNKIGIT